MRLHSAFSLVGLLLLLASGSPASTWASTDFDRDGRGDLVWRHAPTGRVGVWLMDGAALRQGIVIATVADLGWLIVGAGDVDGDGDADLVWHHAATGQVQVWLMDGVTSHQSVAVATLADLAWQIVGVGDVNGDGKVDVVRHHPSTGEVRAWLMDGGETPQDAHVTTVADLGWQIVGIGDVDGDSRADLVGRHALTGDVGVWLMDGVAAHQGAVVLTVPDLGWQMAGIGDVDADGKGDLVWRHTPTGRVAVWLMDGVTLRQGAVVLTVPDLGWQIAGVGDVDGDGKGDLAWRHTPTGDVGVWLMDGVTLRQGVVVFTVPDLGWQIQPERLVRQPQLLNAGVTRTASIEVGGEVDVYEFWVNVPTRVVVQATGRGGALSPCLEISTGVPARPVSGGADCALGKTKRFARVDLTLARGRYEIAVHDSGDNDDGAYNVLLLPLTAELSTPLSPDVSVSSRLDVVGEIHLYQFTVDAPTGVVVEATRASGGTGGISPCLEVYTGTPAQLVSGGTACAANTSTGKVSSLDLELAAGTYLVAVHDAGAEDKGAYNMLFVPLTAAASTALTAGVPQTGTIGLLGDLNLHHFALEASARVVLQVTRSSGGTRGINPCLQVYTGAPAQPVADGAVCAADTSAGTVGRLDLTLPAGTHFVAVRDAGGDEDGDYTVLMLPLTAAASTSLGVGVPQPGAIDGVGDMNLYQFSLAAPTRVLVQVARTSDSTSAAVNPCLEVYTGAPAQLVAGGSVCAARAFRGKVGQLDLALPAGTYFVLVHDAGDDNVGGYDVLISPL